MEAPRMPSMFGLSLQNSRGKEYLSCVWRYKGVYNNVIMFQTFGFNPMT